MPPSLPLFSSLSLLVALVAGPAGWQTGRSPASTTETDVFERSRRSVFLVETESGHGSGFLVDRSGLVVTNHHVIGSGLRVTDDTFIADLNVNSGTSGGPLLNLAGDVVGICTFYMKAPAGPGLAGIMRADTVLAFVDGASAGAPREIPSPERLPVASPTPYPAAALLERALAIRDPSAYGVKINGMRIDVLTPPVVYLLGQQQELRKAKGQRYGWLTHSAEMEAIVAIRAVPELISVPGEPLRFARDLQRLRLLRNGVEVVPIVPGRFCSSSAAQTSFRQPAGCFGLYQYQPAAFAPGAELELHVFSGDTAKPHVWKLPAALVSRVWSDFAPWLSLTERKAR